jgi:hypothetical protein
LESIHYSRGFVPCLEPFFIPHFIPQNPKNYVISLSTILNV